MIPLDFNAVVGQAIEDRIGLGNKVAVIEKEILHYDILRTLHDGGYLEHLVFKGGTCLRLCFGGARFSEDLDFSGGADFDPARLAGLEDALRDHIGTHYGLQVFVAPPKLDGTTVRPIMRWVVRIVTQARLRNAPSQRIKIEIDRHRVARVAHLPLVLNYAHLAESYALFPIRVAQLEEVLTDKLIAFPMSVRERQHPRYRDIWDLRWLVDHRKVALNAELLMDKAMHRGVQAVAEALSTTLVRLHDVVSSEGFRNEMRRFLPEETWRATIAHQPFFEVFETRLRQLLETAAENMKSAR